MATTFVKATEGSGSAKFRTDKTTVGADDIHTPVQLLGYMDDNGNVVLVSPTNPAPVKNPTPSATHIGIIDQPDSALSDEILAVSTGSGTILGIAPLKAGVLISVPADAASSVKVIANGSSLGITLTKGSSQYFVVDNLNKIKVKAVSGSQIIEYFAT